MNTKVMNGVNGSATLTGTAAQTPTGAPAWGAIDILTDTVFTSLTGTMTGYAGVTYPAGKILYGRFTALQLASGSVIAYNF